MQKATSEHGHNLFITFQAGWMVRAFSTQLKVLVVKFRWWNNLLAIFISLSQMDVCSDETLNRWNLLSVNQLDK